MSAAKKRSREGRKVDQEAKSNSSSNTRDVHIVPVTKKYVEDYINNISNINQSIRNDEPSSSFFLEQAHSILAESNELSQEFAAMARQNGLLAAMVQLLLKPCLPLAKMDLLATVLSMLASGDSEVYNNLLRTNVISALVVALTLENSKAKEVLSVAQFLELLLEDNSALLHVLTEEEKKKLISFAKISENESSLCVAGALQEVTQDERFRILEAHFDFMEKQECTDDYVNKFFKVLTNFYSEECPPQVLEKLAFLLLEAKPELVEKPSAAVNNLMANLIPSISEEQLVRFESLFESAFEGIRRDSEDVELLESVSNLMRSLSLTGIWAAEPEDVLILAEHPESVTVMYNLIPICFYVLKHQSSPQESLDQVYDVLQSLGNNNHIELQEEAMEALRNLRIN